MEKNGVFISHIDGERSIALKIQSLLRTVFGDDFPVFVSSDKRSIGGGTNWFAEIVSALRSVRVVLVLLSPDSVDARWINFEAGVGVGSLGLGPTAEGRVIPIVSRGLGKGEVGLPIGQLQVRNLHDAQDLKELLAEVGSLTGKAVPSIGVSSFIQEIQEIEASLPVKGLSLRMHILDRGGDDCMLKFVLVNSGNRDVHPVQLEAVVPRRICSPNWVSYTDGQVVATSEREVGGERFIVLLYKAYDGPTSMQYGQVPRLPPIIPPESERELMPPFSFALRKHLSPEELDLSIQLSTWGRDIRRWTATFRVGDVYERAA